MPDSSAPVEATLLQRRGISTWRAYPVLMGEAGSSVTAIRYAGDSLVVMMQLSRQEVVDILRKTGFAEAADEALRVLPDQVDIDDLAKWGEQRGITREELTSRMGGSP